MEPNAMVVGIDSGPARPRAFCIQPQADREMRCANARAIPAPMLPETEG
jgi:hypothetical protein